MERVEVGAAVEYLGAELEKLRSSCAVGAALAVRATPTPRARLPMRPMGFVVNVIVTTYEAGSSKVAPSRRQ